MWYKHSGVAVDDAEAVGGVAGGEAAGGVVRGVDAVVHAPSRVACSRPSLVAS